MHSGIVRDREVDFEAFNQVEDELASAVKPLAVMAAGTGHAANFSHVESGQVQGFGGFREAVESIEIDY
ncbi:hypothetical protein [Candidatus Binatus sp.]|uniref:hypothetical protein n=1 Tax=Candidatus Binatus sp. TaxID=2811406 RepID=UPI003BE9B5A5